ncbi:MAG TPA: hypothetical protein VLY23_03780 [Candidatus Acidoferrum sp.]|nr:hypothetical protein [Candidatus Acidoferrum sp.]
MDESREDFLAGSALAKNQDRDIQTGCPLDSLTNCLHCIGGPEIDVLRR